MKAIENKSTLNMQPEKHGITVNFNRWNTDNGYNNLKSFAITLKFSFPIPTTCTSIIPPIYNTFFFFVKMCTWVKYASRLEDKECAEGEDDDRIMR